MPNLKSALTFFLYLPSCMVLVGAHVLLSTTLQSYGVSYITTFGERVAATTPMSISLMSNSALICFGTILASVLGVIVSLVAAKSAEAKRFWVMLIACCNYAVLGAMLSAAVAGFFLLPKLANGT